MSKIGISLNIDVTKFDKSAFHQGKKGKYADLTVFVDLDEKDQYGNSGMITQNLGQERKDEKGPILGNCKIFWSDGGNANQQRQAPPDNGFDDDEPPF